MSSEPETFTYKVALLQSAQTVKVYATHAEIWQKDARKAHIDFVNITTARYADTVAREYRLRRLDMDHVEPKPFRVNLTTTLASNRNNDEDVATFLNCVEALAQRLSAIHPDKLVTVGETQKMTRIMFAIGAVAMVFSVGLFGLAIATDVPRYKLQNAAVPFGLLFLFGLYVCKNSNPWTPQPLLKWEEFKTYIAGQ